MNLGPINLRPRGLWFFKVLNSRHRFRFSSLAYAWNVSIEGKRKERRTVKQTTKWYRRLIVHWLMHAIRRFNFRVKMKSCARINTERWMCTGRAGQLTGSGECRVKKYYRIAADTSTTCKIGLVETVFPKRIQLSRVQEICFLSNGLNDESL